MAHPLPGRGGTIGDIHAAATQITVGEIVVLLEEGTSPLECTEHAELCERSQNCPTRMISQEAAQAVFDRLKAISLADLIERGGCGKSPELNEIFTPKRKTIP